MLREALISIYFENLLSFSAFKIVSRTLICVFLLALLIKKLQLLLARLISVTLTLSTSKYYKELVVMLSSLKA